MKLYVTEDGQRLFRLSLPRWLYLNSIGATFFAWRKEVPISARQMRKSVRAIKKVLRQKKLTSIAHVEVKTGDVNVDVMS